ncbi:hypothetical protein BMW23_1181 [Bodo saltans virus]|uniref:Uncharacterized protein n=1 Tax=Bodo saltans virus TaxID=2024608 RepID=A0A2H4UWF4_9VIRU|nr:hypothetical protein QJ851_gp1161 [Bodo saltans virus]ATZ81224.1 hypothetical protein BMW23_1181 [Bodo saltans virus]
MMVNNIFCTLFIRNNHMVDHRIQHKKLINEIIALYV